jgi:hypothetical protein
LRWQANPLWRYEEKIDGHFHAWETGGTVIIGELIPKTIRRAGTVPAAASASPSRWYLWTALAVVAAGAAATGVYFMTRSDDVSVRLVP